MDKLTRKDLYSLEEYEKVRKDFRSKVMSHKELRRLEVGGEMILLFEDRLTMQYQVQEMLRAEKVFDESGIMDELNAYNPLIPEGKNWKFTLMLTYKDMEERKKRLRELVGIEKSLWLKVEGFEKIGVDTKEDLDQGDRGKTSSVHFLSFNLSDSIIHNLKLGSSVTIGVSHEKYNQEVKVRQDCLNALLKDLD